MPGQEIEAASFRRFRRFGVIAVSIITAKAVPRTLVDVKYTARIGRPYFVDDGFGNVAVICAKLVHDGNFRLHAIDQLSDASAVIRNRAVEREITRREICVGPPETKTDYARATYAQYGLSGRFDVGQQVLLINRCRDPSACPKIGVFHDEIAFDPIEQRGKNRNIAGHGVSISAAFHLLRHTEDFLQDNNAAFRLALGHRFVGGQVVTVRGGQFDNIRRHSECTVGNTSMRRLYPDPAGRPA